MMRSVIGVCLMICGLFWMTSANATVQVSIDLTHQSMHVSSGSGSYTWPVSTARSGYVTPRGSFAPYSLQRMHYSHKYHMSPMPYSIFFAGGYAIHGTYSTSQLGHPASHGCVRLSPGNAAQLFQMVQAEGASISISGAPPHSTMFAKVHKRHSVHYASLHKSHAHHTHYASAHHHSAGHGLAYAPVAKPAPNSVRSWQLDPFNR